MPVTSLFRRASAMVFHPRAAWDAIAREQFSPLLLYLEYVVPLAAIGPLATFVALHYIGRRLVPWQIYRASTGEALAQASVSFGFALAGVVLLASMIGVLAPVFGARCAFGRALRVAAYAFTPAWLAGILAVYPPLGALQLVAVAYAFYQLVLGLHAVVGVSGAKAAAYAGLAVICAVAAGFVLGAFAARLQPHAIACAPAAPCAIIRFACRGLGSAQCQPINPARTGR